MALWWSPNWCFGPSPAEEILVCFMIGFVFFVRIFRHRIIYTLYKVKKNQVEFEENFFKKCCLILLSLWIRIGYAKSKHFLFSRSNRIYFGTIGVCSLNLFIFFFLISIFCVRDQRESMKKKIFPISNVSAFFVPPTFPGT